MNISYREAAALLSALLSAACSQNNEPVAAPSAAASSAPAAAQPPATAANTPPAKTMSTKAVSPQILSQSSGLLDTAPMVLVPAGEFIMGSEKTDTEGIEQQYGFSAPIYLDEHPQHKAYLPAFKIDMYEVSNKQFKTFILVTDRALPYEWGHNGYGLTMAEAQKMDLERLRSIGADDFKLDMDTTKMSRDALMAVMQQEQAKRDPFPVTGISWHYADAYCRWRGHRLPTEAEWEKAARGSEGFEFPWGNDWNAALANTGDDSDWEDGIAPVGSYPNNKSPYGAFDMAGNVWEWVSDWYHPYPGSTYQSENFGTTMKVIRGGGGGIGHYALSYFFRGATRQFAEPAMAGEDVGFRCAADVL
jgi:formylglycine-generating enzyme required for sulfatase activity